MGSEEAVGCTALCRAGPNLLPSLDHEWYAGRCEVKSRRRRTDGAFTELGKPSAYSAEPWFIFSEYDKKSSRDIVSCYHLK